MYQFFESICCVDKKLRNIDLHQSRFDRTRNNHFKESALQKISLEQSIEIPTYITYEKYKVRIVFDKKIQAIEFIPYQIKPIKTVRLFNIHQKFSYSYKHLDRTFLNDCLNQSQADDLILVQSGCITDAIYTNIVFYDGKEWITPKSYLLQGTMREYLLRTKKIREMEIKVSDLHQFQSFKRVNAMMNLEESQEIDINVLFVNN